MGQSKQTNTKHGPGHLVGDHQASGRGDCAASGSAAEKAPGGLVGNFQDGRECGTSRAAPDDNLGRPDTNEDKDMNVEQLKSRNRGKASSGGPVGQPARDLEAGRVDSTGRTRAGERS